MDDFTNKSSRMKSLITRLKNNLQQGYPKLESLPNNLKKLINDLVVVVKNFKKYKHTEFNELIKGFRFLIKNYPKPEKLDNGVKNPINDLEIFFIKNKENISESTINLQAEKLMSMEYKYLIKKLKDLIKKYPELKKPKDELKLIFKTTYPEIKRLKMIKFIFDLLYCKYQIEEKKKELIPLITEEVLTKLISEIKKKFSIIHNIGVYKVGFDVNKLLKDLKIQIN